MGYPAYLIEARDDSGILGVLPLCLVSGPIFGKFLVSLPYVNTGGCWTTNPAAAAAMIDAACELADQKDVKYLELRHEAPFDHPKFNFTRTDKVHMRLELPETPEALLASFKAKVRSQIKKSGTYPSEVTFGKHDQLEAFYDVFAINMRDLGTPVFSKRLFARILDQFDDDAELCVVRRDDEAIAGALLVHNNGVTEVPSASTLRAHNRSGVNMWMYRHLLDRAIQRGSHTFDFGRSSEGSGTYKFKKQWGAVAHPATWQYYVRKGSPEDMKPDSDGKQTLVKIWQKLPVWLTRRIGPPIVRGIP